MAETDGASLGCARCGDCCENIYLSTTLDYLKQWTTEALKNTPDPRDDDAWKTWWQDESRGNPWSDSMREVAVKRYDPEGRYRRDADFIVANWSATGVDEDGDTRYACAKFDAVHRLCTVHDDQPYICSGYPWYGEKPTPGRILKTGSQCSYLLDIAPVDRPDNARPLIPIDVLKH
jgi:Fe-S-cluster containining protein